MALAGNLRTLIVLGAVASLMVTGAIWVHQAVAQDLPACPADWPGQGYEGSLRPEDHGRIQYQDYHTDADGQRWYIIRSSDSNGYTTIRAYPASDDADGGYYADSPDQVCYLIVREPGAEADAASSRQVEFPPEQEPEPTPTPYPIQSQPVSVDLTAGEAAVLTQDGGAQLEVPEGATTEPTTASITEVPPPSSNIAAGRVFDFSLGETELAAPVILRIPFDLESGGDASRVRAVHWDEDANDWVAVPSEVDAAGNSVAVAAYSLSLFSTTTDENVSEYASITSCGVSSSQASIGVKTAELTLVADVENYGYDKWYQIGPINPTMYVRFTLEDPERGLSLEVTTPRQEVEEDQKVRFSSTLDPATVPMVGWPKAQKERAASISETRKGQLSLLPIKWFPGSVNVSCQLEVGDLNPFDDNDILDLALNSGAVGVSQYGGGGQPSCVPAAPGQGPFLQGEDISIEVQGSTSRLFGGVEYWVYRGGERIAHGGAAKQRSGGANANPSTTVSVTADQPGSYTIDCALWGHVIRNAYVSSNDDTAVRNALDKVLGIEGSLQTLIGNFKAVFTGFLDLHIESGLLNQFEQFYGPDSESCDRTAYLSKSNRKQLSIQSIEREICDYALQGLKTYEFDVVAARWGELDINPSTLPSQGGDRDVTVRVYTQESRDSGTAPPAPTITAVLPMSLAPPGTRTHWEVVATSCDATAHGGYDQHCWQVVFEDVPENSARAEKNDAGQITETNEAEVRIEVSADRNISGTAPSGSFSILGRSPYETDREPLEVLYLETRGEFWRTKDHWTDTDTDIHEWYGVNDFSLLNATEKEADQVSSLELNANNLRGDLPAEVGYLTSLKFLILAANDNLQGQIPGSLGELTNLEYLDLSGNRLSRQIPSTLGNLKNLKLLDLSDNNLIGEIPSNFDELPALQSLYLADNRLTGCIPAGLRDLRNDDFDDMDLPFCDAALSSLTISPGQLEPEFETHTMGYSATVDQSQVAIFPVNDHGATFEYYVGSSRTPATDAGPSAPGFQVDLGCGETTVRIKVISADGESYTVAVTREGGGDIVAPTIRSVSNGVESLTVYWNAPEMSCPGDIDHYNLRYSLDQDDADWTEVRGPSGSLSHTIRGLTAGTTYRVQAQAVVAGVAGPWSESATGTPRRRSTTQRPQPSQPGLSADYTVNEGDGLVSLSIPVVASPPGAEIQRVNISTRDDSATSRGDYDSYNESFTFDSDAPATISVSIQIHDDLATEPTERFFIDVEVTTATETTQTTLTAAILDNDLTYVEFGAREITIVENRTVVMTVQVSHPRITCPFAGNLYVDLSFSDPNNALTATHPAPSSLTFILCRYREAFRLSLGDVSGDVQVIGTITDVRTDNAELNSRVLPGDQSSVTINVMDISRR